MNKASRRVVCPKCYYLRKDSDNAPEWQCPNCGVVYAKYEHPSAQIKHHGRKKWFKNKKTISFIGKLIIFVLLAIVVAIVWRWAF